MYHPASRVLMVLELLQSHAQMSGAELAERLEVDRRTIRRYLIQLQDMGIPVEAERGRYGTYRLRPGYKLPPLMFSEGETIALVLGLLSVQQSGLESANLAVEGALAKIFRVMPHELRDRAQAIRDTLIVEGGPSDSQRVTHGVVGTMGLAVRQQRQVRLSYRSLDGAVSERVFDPYGLVARSGRWYTIGYCHLRSAQRTFRLDRVMATELLDDTFLRPADFDPLAEIERAIASIPQQHPVDILFKAPLEDVQAQIPKEFGQLTMTEKGVQLTSQIQNVRWLALFLLDVTLPFVIQKPTELREELQHIQAQIHQILAE